MYSSVPMSKLDVTLLQTLFQILLWIQPTFLSTMGFHSCSLHWMQSITDMSKGELCRAPLSPIKTENIFQNMIERLVDPAQFFMLNPCHGWDELNKILYGFEYRDLLKTFQAYSFYPFLIISHTHRLSKATFTRVFPFYCWESWTESCQLCATKLPMTYGSQAHSVWVHCWALQLCWNLLPVSQMEIWTLSLQMHNIYKLVVLPLVLY